jgi:large subunit ribosomal protein L15
MKVHDLTPPPGSRKRGKRVARGIGGKGGKTCRPRHEGPACP